MMIKTQLSVSYSLMIGSHIHSLAPSNFFHFFSTFYFSSSSTAIILNETEYMVRFMDTSFLTISTKCCLLYEFKVFFTTFQKIHHFSFHSLYCNVNDGFYHLLRSYLTKFFYFSKFMFLKLLVAEFMI